MYRAAMNAMSYVYADWSAAVRDSWLASLLKDDAFALAIALFRLTLAPSAKVLAVRAYFDL